MTRSLNELHSDHLFFRPLTTDDVTETYVNWLNDPRINQYLEVRHTEQTIEECRLFVEQMNRAANQHLFGIFLKINGQHIGNAKLGFINDHYQSGQVSLFIGDKDSWGKGFATETVNALTEFGFTQLGLYKLEAGCYEENLASLRVFLRCGYSVEGFLRNHVVSNGSRMGCFWLGVSVNEWHK